MCFFNEWLMMMTMTMLKQRKNDIKWYLDIIADDDGGGSACCLVSICFLLRYQIDHSNNIHLIMVHKHKFYSILFPIFFGCAHLNEFQYYNGQNIHYNNKFFQRKIFLIIARGQNPN